MKRIAAFALALAIAPLLHGQTVTIDNTEGELLLFAVVPAVEMPEGDRIRAAVADGTVEMRYVPPGGALTDVPRAEGEGLVGTFVSPGRDAHPVVFTGPLEDSYVRVSRAYTRTEPGGRPLTVSQDLVDEVLSAEPVVIDNDYTDWEAVPQTAAFSAGMRPTEGIRTRAGRSTRIPTTDALYWGKGGTVVDGLKLVSSEDYAYGLIETAGAITRGASYTFYAYADRNQSQASYTVEIAVTDGSSGFVFLWTAAGDTPRIVGEFTYEPFYLEARLDLSKMPAGLPRDVSNLSFDVSSSFAGARVTEEFFYTTVYARDIVYRSPTGL